MADFDSGDQHRLAFRTSLRGYDRADVDARLRELAEEIEGLREERDRLAARLHAGGDRDLAAEFEAVSREVGEVLEAARVAAEGMRERAAAETARWRSETLAGLEAETRQAKDDAEHLRGDAWTTAEELLKQSQREAAHIVEEAREESLRLIGEAERQAHRIESAARRESEESVRTARMEAERLVLDAQERHDEIIETASRQAEIASERTRALELRRDELRKELDAVRAALSTAEGELDERRAVLGLAEPEDVETERPASWVPGETVRVVRPQALGQPPAEAPAPEQVDPETAVDLGEVRVISASELAKVGDLSEHEEPQPEADTGQRPEPPDVEEIVVTESAEGGANGGTDRCAVRIDAGLAVGAVRASPDSG
jgi:DivIVA domain-containing protein